jgi:hypothetical protein
MDDNCLKIIIEQLCNSCVFNKNYNAFLKQMDEANTLQDRLCLFTVDVRDAKDRHNFSKTIGISVKDFNSFLTDNVTWHHIVDTFKIVMGPPDKVTL